MSAFSSRNRGSGRAWHLIAGIAIVVVLVLRPPVLPHFGPSLAAPLTTSTLSQLALLLAWIVLLLLALALLQRALVPTRALLPPAWATRSTRRPVQSPSLLGSAKAPPRLLVRRETTTTAASADATVESDRDADHDEAPAIDTPVATVGLLGPVTIQGVARPRRATTVELLAYLALHPEGASRDELLEAIWPGEDPRRTRPRLWQAVSEARRLLGDAFQRDGERYALDRARVRTDVDELDRLLAGLDDTTGSEPDPILDRALALWRGAPLAGTDYAWADGDVRRLSTALATLLERAGRTCLAAGDGLGALCVAERGLELDALNEVFVRLALEADAGLGRRQHVADRYEAFRRRLDADLGIEPERETLMLYRRLLSPDG